MDKTIYAVDSLEWGGGIEEAYENADRAKRVILENYLKWVKKKNEKVASGSNSCGREVLVDDMCKDIIQLLNEGYIDDFAYIQAITLYVDN